MFLSTLSTITTILPVSLLIGIAILCVSLTAFCILITYFVVVIHRSYPISSDKSILLSQILPVLKKTSRKRRRYTFGKSKTSLEQINNGFDHPSTSHDAVDQFSYDKEIQCPTTDMFSTDSLTITSRSHALSQSTVASENKTAFEVENKTTLMQLQSSKESLAEFFLNNSTLNKISPSKMPMLPCIKLRMPNDTLELSRITITKAPQSLHDTSKRSIIKDIARMEVDENSITVTTSAAPSQNDAQTRQIQKHRTLPFSINSCDSQFSKDSLAD
ncbi:unnamed protein product [Didymodactylos carnosus]|uniref:Uncharacterized protein n=1 Tax=Didymodactylos carnosus TaxID=1234261 RepID=A0A8S2GM04_9BILA|nr:unnamed protein product [Didymodactylos carnosus]CAF3517709.1 unnamed protein product [Didymodactylos carnosus]